MKIFIPKEISGTYPLLIKDKTFSIVEEQDIQQNDIDTIIFGTKSYHEIRKIYNLPYRNFPPKRFKSSLEKVLSENIKKYNIPWHQTMPKNLYRKELKIFLNNLSCDFNKKDFTYYKNTFVKSTKIFTLLSQAAINYKKYVNYFEKCDEATSKSVLNSFKPISCKNGIWFCDHVFYNRISSTTGRLTVKQGPQILTLKKTFRDIISSRFGNEGKIFYIDYKSLEPRLLLAMRSKKENIPKDLYLYVMKELNLEGDIKRETIKTAIISMIYGAGAKELQRQLSAQISRPEEFINSIREYFEVESLKEKLKKEYEKNSGKYIQNLYGRPIFAESVAPYVLINYFLQSSAVDVALLGFNKIIKFLKKANGLELIKPIFLLHDALLLDVHNDVQHLIPMLAEVGSNNIPKLSHVKFWTECETV